MLASLPTRIAVWSPRQEAFGRLHAGSVGLLMNAGQWRSFAPGGRTPGAMGQRRFMLPARPAPADRVGLGFSACREVQHE